MNITMLKGKLHLASVTHSELLYDGSCAIDEDLIRLAGFREFERIDIYNVSNGERFSTYVIVADQGSRTISLNGAAARKAQVGDKVIIAAYASLLDSELSKFETQLVYLGDGNSVDYVNTKTYE